jgi:hypothetical protein
MYDFSSAASNSNSNNNELEDLAAIIAKASTYLDSIVTRS